MAKQLSENYGDRAWTVCALAEPTGEQWPVHGVRLSPNYPYVEAEVLYATRHEYACTAVDVLARRTRLAFVDAQAALAALPRVIDIMSQELGWSRARQRGEYVRGVQFLGSMGLVPAMNAAAIAQQGSESSPASSWRTWFEDGFGLAPLLGLAGTPTIRPSTASSFRPSYSRTKFEAGEVDGLKELFDKHAVLSSSPHTLARMNKGAIQPALEAFAHEWPELGYEALREADYRYVFAQEELGDMDFEQFIEVRLWFLWRMCVCDVHLLPVDLWIFEGCVYDERGQGGQEGAETDSGRKERWRRVVVLFLFLLSCWACLFISESVRYFRVLKLSLHSSFLLLKFDRGSSKINHSTVILHKYTGSSRYIKTS